MKKILTYYSFIIVTLMFFVGFLSAKTFPQLIAATLFFPLTLYFWLKVFPRRNNALVLPHKILKPLKINDEDKLPEIIPLQPVDAQNTKQGRAFDLDRRTFIKLIGSAGLSLFIFSLFTKKAEAAFFGSVPGSGTVAIKDSSGVQIDPAKHHPTDGYKLAELDDSAPAYYGFVNKDGAWYILKEENGAYKYRTGSSGFSTAWSNRAQVSPAYVYYDTAFS